MHTHEPRTSAALEQSALGAALLYPEVVTLLRSILEPEHFADATHAVIWRAIVLLDEQGIVPDAMSVAGELETMKRGGARCPQAIEIEALRGCAPARADAAEGVARKVAGLAYGRRVHAAAVRIQRMAADATVSLSELVESAPRLISEATTRLEERAPVDSGQLAVEVWNEIERLQQYGKPAGISTGLRDIDRLARLKPGGLWVLAGRPAMGKSALALRLARAVAEQGQPVLFFSLEMPRRELFLRMACDVAGVDGQSAESGTLTHQEMDALAVALDRLAKLPIEIDDDGEATLFDLKARSQRFRQRRGALGLVVVDYLQLVKAGRGSKSDNREQEVGEISRGGKALAKQLDTTVLMLSQLNRKCEERTDKRPLISDLRESGSVEQDADVVCLLYRDEYYNRESEDRGVCEAIIAKQRGGPTGTARLAFHAPLTRFADLEQGEVVRLPQAKPSRPRRQPQGSRAADARAGGDDHDYG